ncbi:hypothetical protein HDU86_003539 [Geranomyces michiganensis]|nr:hypothetical protein HDU86_003539 [Geranomyces michiganensis]
MSLSAASDRPIKQEESSSDDDRDVDQTSVKREDRGSSSSDDDSDVDDDDDEVMVKQEPHSAAGGSENDSDDNQMRIKMEKPDTGSSDSVSNHNYVNDGTIKYEGVNSSSSCHTRTLNETGIKEEALILSGNGNDHNFNVSICRPTIELLEREYITNTRIIANLTHIISDSASPRVLHAKLDILRRDCSSWYEELASQYTSSVLPTLSSNPDRMVNSARPDIDSLIEHVLNTVNPDKTWLDDSLHLSAEDVVNVISVRKRQILIKLQQMDPEAAERMMRCDDDAAETDGGGVKEEPGGAGGSSSSRSSRGPVRSRGRSSRQIDNSTRRNARWHPHQPALDGRFVDWGPPPYFPQLRRSYDAGAVKSLEQTFPRPLPTRGAKKSRARKKAAREAREAREAFAERVMTTPVKVEVKVENPA